jgi:hypothetical protein
LVILFAKPVFSPCLVSLFVQNPHLINLENPTQKSLWEEREILLFFMSNRCRRSFPSLEKGVTEKSPSRGEKIGGPFSCSKKAASPFNVANRLSDFSLSLSGPSVEEKCIRRRFSASPRGIENREREREREREKERERERERNRERERERERGRERERERGRTAESDSARTGLFFRDGIRHILTILANLAKCSRLAN